MSNRGAWQGIPIAVVLCIGLTGMARAATGAEIRFVSPRNLSTALGKTEIVLEVQIPEGLHADKVEVFVDNQLLARLAAPPWRAAWDAGEGQRGHRLDAVLHLSDGSVVRSVIQTSALNIQYVEKVDLVNLYAVVRDRSGRHVTNLTQEDFRIRENGRPQVVERFSTDRKPLRIAVVLDVSRTMLGDKIAAARESATDLLEVLEPGDEGMLVTFSDAVTVAQGLTGDRKLLAQAIARTEAVGGTALYDAIWETAGQLERFDGRRVIVLLSDGRDEAASGLEPGSFHTMEEALDRALRNEVMVFAIGVGKDLRYEMDFYRRQTLEQILNRLAETTGGRAAFTARSGKLQRAFAEVANDLRHQYSIAYTSDDPRHDGSWRSITLTTVDPDLKVSSRKGYYSRKN